MTLGTKLMLVALAFILYALVTAIYRVLGNWSEQAISRHELLLESQRRRAAYYEALAERQGLSNDSIEVLE